MLSEQYPDFANFLGAWFPDADFEGLDDVQVAVRFASTTSSHNLMIVLEQGRQLIACKNLPWEEIGSEANRHFDRREEARSWLRQVVDALNSATRKLRATDN